MWKSPEQYFQAEEAHGDLCGMMREQITLSSIAEKLEITRKKKRILMMPVMLWQLLFVIQSNLDMMMEYLQGKLHSKAQNIAIIDVNGMGYLCHITSNTYDKCPQSGEIISLLIHFHVTENSQELFGFYDEKERTMFRMLIGISGIGPKTAIAMLSSISPQEFKKRIISSEVSMLTVIPGIGTKTAKNRSLHDIPYTSPRLLPAPPPNH